MWRFKQTGILFTDTMLTLPTGCVNEEEWGLGLWLVWFSLSEKRSSQRHRCTTGFPGHILPQKAKPNTSVCLPSAKGHEGAGESARENWALTVFYVDCGGSGPALHPTEMAHMLLHFRSTSVADHFSSLDSAVQYQHWTVEAPGAWMEPARPLSLPFA